MRNYADTIAYLFGRLPVYQRTGTFTGKLDLSKAEALLAALGNPHRQLACLHVAGTNGKGTVSHTLAALLQAAGLHVGLYTSPHYVDYRERIRVDGKMVAEEYVVAFVEQHAALLEAIEASFFEFTVAMAFAYLAEHNVDVAVIEVGLGGRLDSTNVLEEPLVSVITNIDLDHTEMLGKTLAAIATEKAGIIKQGCPVVIGRRQEESWPVFERVAQARQARLMLASDRVQVKAAATGGLTVVYGAEQVTLAAEQLDVRGPFAAENVQTALAAYEVVRSSLALPSPDLKALGQLRELTGYVGRFLTLSQNPLVVCDAGHNPAAWRVLVPEVVALRPKAQQLVVCGFVRGKQPDDFLRLWPAETRFFIGDLDLPRNLPVAETAALIEQGGYRTQTFSSIAAAFRAAENEADHQDLIFVGGSSYVVGALLEFWRKPEQ